MNSKIPLLSVAVFLSAGLFIQYQSNSLEKYVSVTVFILFAVLSRILWTNIFVFLKIITATFLIEAVGVATGFPFGLYSYSTSSLILSIFNVPLFIPLAWFVLLSSVRQVTKNSQQAVLMIIGLDLILERFAVLQGLWKWQNLNVILTAPIQNYISWGLITLLLYQIIPKRENLKNGSKIILTILCIYMILSIIITS